MLTRQMGYWEFLCSSLQDLYAGNGNTCMAVHLQGNLDFATLKQSLQCLYQKHPLLRSSYHATDEQQYFLTENIQFSEVPIQQESITCTPEQWPAAWQQKITAILAEQYQPRQPLWRMTLLSNQDNTHCLLFAMHHAIADGRSQASIIHEIANFYKTNATDIDSMPFPECVEKRLSDVVTWEQYGKKHQQLTAKSKPMATLNNYGYKSADQASCNIHVCDFTVQQMQKLRDCCRQRKIKVTALLCAALLLAERQHFGVDSISLHVAVNLRHRCQPVIASDEVGCLISMVPCYFDDLAEVDSVWDLAASHQQHFDEGFALMANTPADYPIEKLTTNYRAALDNPPRTTFDGGGGITNWGYVDMPSHIGDAKFLGVHRASNQRCGGLPFFFHIASMETGIFGAFSYAEPFISDEWMQKFSASFREILLSHIE